MSSIIKFEDIFGIKELDPAGKAFERVSRIVAVSENYETELHLDINTQLYPMTEGERFTLVLASTLDESGQPSDGTYNSSGDPSLADKYEYVMHGKVYLCEEDKHNNRLSVFVSYGGLLMRLKGDARSLQGIDLDSMIYLLIRKS
eukprot:m.337215 g.337215  ORF g.337215 m.337215 type:complete len:145 (+) comp20547_c1_seq2:123-557(+)